MGLIRLLVGGAVEARKAIKENSAKKDETTQTVVVNNRYSVELPSFLKQTTRLNDEASLQYWDKTIEFYTTVIDEDKEEFEGALKELKKRADNWEDTPILDSMAAFSLQNMFEDLDKLIKSEFVETEINGLKALTFSILDKKRWSTSIYYQFGFIEGKDTLYQIISWTIGENANMFKDKMEKIIFSFNEL
jgi:hypothetical protein